MKTLKDIQNSVGGKARHATYTNKSTPAGHFAFNAKILGSEHIYLLEGEEGEPNAPIKGNIVVWGNHNNKDVELVIYRGSGILGGELIGTVEGLDYARAFKRILFG